jgi:WD40 repeat protein
MLWEAKTGKKLHVFHGHGSDVWEVALSPNGRRLVTASADGTTRIWDVETNKELARLLLLDSVGNWLLVTPEGDFDGSPGATQFISYRENGSLKLVPTEPYARQSHRPGLLATVWNGR